MKSPVALGSFSRIFNETSVVIPFSPLLHEENYHSNNKLEYGHGTCGSDYFEKRQMFLRSYHFTLKPTLSEKLRTPLRKLKGAVWTIIACKFYSRPSNQRRFKCMGNRYRVSNNYGLWPRLHLPQCLRVPLD
eukprot:Gb_36515 [translate_table: standard]